MKRLCVYAAAFQVFASMATAGRAAQESQFEAGRRSIIVVRVQPEEPSAYAR